MQAYPIRLAEETDTRDIITMDIDLDAITRSYLDSALWADYERSYDKGMRHDDLPAFTWVEAINDVELFVTTALESDPDILNGLSCGDIGHNLWLTRQGHGAGFWSRDLGARGDALTRIVHAILPETWLDLGETDCNFDEDED